jgi:hypothetical protein
MTSLHQVPLPIERVNILPVIRILRTCKDRIQIAKGWDRGGNSSDLAAQLVHTWNPGVTRLSNVKNTDFECETQVQPASCNAAKRRTWL